MKKKSITGCAFIIAAIVPVFIQAQEAWTLRQCIDYAVEHNINIRQSENSVEQNKLDANTAKWARLPNLNGSSGQNLSWGRAASPIDNTYTNTSSSNTSFSLSTNVPLFTGFQLSNQYELTKLNLKAAVEDLNKAKEDIAVNVTSGYIQVLFNQELSKVAEGQVAISKEQLNRVLRLAEVGKASPVQVAEAKARVAQDETSAVQADNNYRLALLDLSQLLELPNPESLILAAPDVEIAFVPLTAPDDIYELAITDKPSILAAQYRLQGSEKSIRIAESNRYPQLSLGGGLSTSYYTMTGRTSDAFGAQLNHNLNEYIGLSLSIPIFNRFSVRNRVHSARLQQTYYSIQLENSKKALYKEIQQAWYSALAAESKYKSSDASVSANEETFRLTSERFENGKATSIEYNEAKQNLMRAISDRIQSKYEYLFRTKILDFYKGLPIQ
ncbi:Toxin and drug export protein A [termite gut metagenome]|uniref:Toxin and drug export protein A n=1 Tax=termite gut metagenome TaxID=433724 RepID=A0A5J4RY08_9ZZZZ